MALHSLSRVPVAHRPVAIWIETALLVLLVPALGLWLNPSDPLFVRSAFPWAVLAPLLAGLRYGFAPGFAAAAALALVTIAAWKGTLPLRFPAGDLSAQRTVGLVLCGMITGEFSGLWRRRLEALETVHGHQRLRFESLVRSHQALRVSQDLLESRLGGGPPTLREALRALADLAVVDEGGREALARQILDLFATFAQVRQGAVFLAAEPDAPLPAKATAALGAAPELSDPIVEEALRRRELVAFDSACRRDEGRGRGRARSCWRRRSRTWRASSGACWWSATCPSLPTVRRRAPASRRWPGTSPTCSRSALRGVSPGRTTRRASMGSRGVCDERLTIAGHTGSRAASCSSRWRATAPRRSRRRSSSNGASPTRS